MNAQLSKWHRFVETQDPDILHEIVDDNVRFHSPFVWKPKEGKEITIAILLAAGNVFDEFSYIREIIDSGHWALEFEAKIGGLSLRGIDLIEIGDIGKIVDFEVMIRPANALQMVGNEMSKRLS